VEQVAVARLHVDELVADVVRQPGCRDVVVDQDLEIVVGPDAAGVLRIDLELLVEQRVMVRDPRRPLGVIGRFAKAAGVSELQADEQPVERAGLFEMTRAALFEQLREALLVVGRRERLVRVRAAAGLHGRRFAPPDELRAAAAEVPPPP
jgi:hypothetical protein